MKNAYECREEFNERGRCIKRERCIGPIIPWSIIAFLALSSGRSIPTLPAGFGISSSPPSHPVRTTTQSAVK